ncbi:MAG TPA: sulfurtransferase TusA family protein [Acidimicrobiia bacterium]|jgi:tRNA 2-thiouridine synthesizing protein A|nr:sulfurtransferase TusA family protein [Acidimicrobiia bacterium]
MADIIVDARNLQCPMPVLKLSQAVSGAAAGQTIELVATDRGALSDIPAWSKDTGNPLKEQFEQDSEYHFVVEKA